MSLKMRLKMARSWGVMVDGDDDDNESDFDLDVLAGLSRLFEEAALLFIPPTKGMWSTDLCDRYRPPPPPEVALRLEVGVHILLLVVMHGGTPNE